MDLIKANHTGSAQDAAAGPDAAAALPGRALLRSPSASGLGPSEAEGRAIAAEAPADDLSVTSLLAALRRRWAIAVALAVVVGAAAAVGQKFVPPAYTGETLLRVRGNPPSIMFDLPDGRESANLQRSHLVLIKSRHLLQKALTSPEVADLPAVRSQKVTAAWLESRVQADYSIAQEILRITMTGEDPTALEALLRAVRDTFLSEVLNKDYHERLLRLEHLQKVCRDWDKAGDTKRQELRDRAKKLGFNDPQLLVLKRQSDSDQLGALRNEASLLKARIDRARHSLSARNGDEIPPLDPAALEASAAELVAAAPKVRALAEDVARLERDLARVEAQDTVGPSHPRYSSLKKELDLARKALAAGREAALAEAREQLRLRHRSEYLNQLRQQRQQIDQWEEYAQILAGEIERRTRENDALSREVTELDSVREEINRANDLARQAAVKVQALQVEMQAPPRASVFEDVLVKQTDGLKRLMKYVGMPALAVLGIGICGVVFLEARTGKVCNSEQVARSLGIPFIGSLPEEPAWALRCREGSRQLRVGDAADPFLDAVDADCTILWHAADLSTPQVIFVASAQRGEGKTALACHLALGFARAGFKTLLVDADLRNPSLHHLFNLPPRPGFGDLLRGTCEIEDVLQPAPVEGLDLITVGQGGPNSLLESRYRIPALFQRFRSDYQVILMDTAPLLSVPDTLSLAEHADGAVLAVRRDVSRLPAIRAASHRLGLLRCPVVGAVVSGVRRAHAGALPAANSFRDP